MGLLKTQHLFILSLIIATIGIAGISGCASMQSVTALKEMGKSQEYMEEWLKQETANFRRIKKYINSNKIEKGLSCQGALRKFGEPVLILPEKEGKRWVYKPSQSNWLGGEKIYLFFDKDDKLISWECLNCSQ